MLFNILSSLVISLLFVFSLLKRGYIDYSNLTFFLTLSFIVSLIFKKIRIIILILSIILWIT